MGTSAAPWRGLQVPPGQVALKAQVQVWFSSSASVAHRVSSPASLVNVRGHGHGPKANVVHAPQILQDEAVVPPVWSVIFSGASRPDLAYSGRSGYVCFLALCRKW